MFNIFRRKPNFDRYAFIVFAAVFIFAGFLLYSFLPRASTKWGGPDAMKVAITPVYLSALDGLPTGENEQMPQVVAVMIDNHEDAIPQAGLSVAPVVYEAPVEGGFTRYMGIYPSSSTLEKVGPVRSARPYYLDWSREYGNALYMHCGGSPEALSKIKSENIFAANEFYNGSYYWRDNRKYAPHNLFTKAENWMKLLDKKNATKKEWQGWQFGADLPAGEWADIKKINIAFSRNYEAGWEYDLEKKVFRRQIDGRSHLDTAGQVTADNILIQFASVEIIDDVGRRKIDTVGQGEARVLRDGKIIKGIWKKTGIYDRTRFYDMTDTEIPLKPGRTWVEVVPLGTVLEITN